MSRLIGIVLAVMILAISSGMASGAEKNENSFRTKRAHSIRSRVYEKLEQAQEAQGAKNLTGALEILQGMLGGNLSEYETAMVWNLIGGISYEQDNLRGAIEAFRNVIKQQDIPEGMRAAVLYGLAQLYVASEDYRQALQILDQWFEMTPEPSGDAYALKAQANYQLQRYQQAVSPLLTALELSRQKGLLIKESWLGLLRASYYELDDFKNTAKILELLLVLYPQKAYWKQLAWIYGMLDREKDQLATTEAAWEQGFLDSEKEITNLAQLYMYHEVPWKAARVLEAGMKSKIIKEKYKNLRLYAQALALAQESEKQIPAMEKATKIAPDGEMNIYLAQAYMERGEWKKAARSLADAVSKGVRRPGNARMMLGIARFNSENLKGAAEAFRAAAKDHRETVTARRWLKHVKSEQYRREALAAYAAAQ